MKKSFVKRMLAMVMTVCMVLSMITIPTPALTTKHLELMITENLSLKPKGPGIKTKETLTQTSGSVLPSTDVTDILVQLIALNFRSEDHKTEKTGLWKFQSDAMGQTIDQGLKAYEESTEAWHTWLEHFGSYDTINGVDDNKGDLVELLTRETRATVADMGEVGSSYILTYAPDDVEAPDPAHNNIYVFTLTLKEYTSEPSPGGGGSGGGGTGGGVTGGDGTGDPVIIIPPKVYGVYVDGELVNATLHASHEVATEGTLVTVEANCDEGYEVEELTILTGVYDEIKHGTLGKNVYYFYMPATDVYITMTTRDATEYKINVAGVENGQVTASHSQAAQGTKVAVDVKPDSGYAIKSFEVQRKNGEFLKTTYNEADGTYTFTMPAEEVNVIAVMQPSSDALTMHDIAVDTDIGATVSTAVNKAVKGQEVKLTLLIHSGYQQESFQIVKASGGTVDPVNNGDGVYTFTMPDEKVTIKVDTERIISKYKVNVNKPEHATVTATPDEAAKGTKITVTVTTDEGYATKSFEVHTKSGTLVVATYDEIDKTYTFTMPAEDVDVTVTTQPGDEEDPQMRVIGVEAAKGATVRTSVNKAAAGTDVTAVVTIGSDYKFGTFVIKKFSGGTVPYEDKGNGVYTFTMPDENVTIVVTTKKLHNIVLWPDSGAELVAVPQRALEGETVTVGVDIKLGYELDSFKVADASGKPVKHTPGDNNSYTFIMPDNAVVVAVATKKIAEKHAVNVQEVTGATVKATPNLAAEGVEIRLDVSIDPSYVVKLFIVKGRTSGTELVPEDKGNGVFTFTMPDESVDVILKVEELTKYNVTVAAAEHANVELSAKKAAEGEVLKVTVKADAGYTMQELQIKDKSGTIVTATPEGDGVYTFKMPASDVSVSVITTANPYKINVQYDEDQASVTCPKEAVTGEKVSFTVAAQSGYEVEKVEVKKVADGNLVTCDQNGGNYTFNMPAGAVTVHVITKQIQYTVYAPLNDYATVNLSANKATSGQTVTATVTAKSGYKLTGVEVKDASGKTVSSNLNGKVCTFTMPAADVTVTATTEAIKYNVTVADNGYVDYVENVVLSAEKATVGQKVTATVTVKDGYELTSLKVVGKDTKRAVTVVPDGKGGYTFDMPAEDVTVTLTIEKEAEVKYRVIVIPNEHAEATTFVTEAAAGRQIEVHVEADEGYKVTSVKYNGIAAVKTGDGIYTFTMPAANVEVTVTTEAVEYKVTALHNPLAVVKLDKNTATIGDKITATVTVNPGCKLVGMEVKDADGKTVGHTQTADGCTFEMPASNVTVNAIVAAITYKVKAVHDLHAVVLLSKTEATIGQAITANVVVDDGYKLTGVVVKDADGKLVPSTLNDKVCSFEMPASDVTVTATTEAIEYTVSAAYHEYAVVKLDKNTATIGETITATVNVDSGYKLTGVEVKDAYGNSVPNALNDNICTFKMPAADVTVTVATQAVEYNIVAVHNDHAKVDLSDVKATIGKSVVINVNVESGYAMTKLTVSGASGIVEVNSISDGIYSFEMPGEDVTVTVSVEKKPPAQYNITVIQPDHAVLSTLVSRAAAGQAVEVHVNENAGYEVTSVKVNDVDVAKDSNGIYTFNMPAAHVTITATTEAIEYTVSAPANDHADVALSEEKATIGELIAATVTEKPGYQLTDVVVTDAYGKRVPSTLNGKVCTFNMPAADVTVTVTTEAIEYTVSAAASEHAVVNLNKEKATIGETVNATVKVDPGYKLTGVVVKEVGSNNPVHVDVDLNGKTGTFTMPAADVTVTVTTEAIGYTVTVADNDNVEKVDLQPGTTATISTKVTATVTVKAGYKLAGVEVTEDTSGKKVPSTLSGNVCTFNMPADDVTITVITEAIKYKVDAPYNKDVDRVDLSASEATIGTKVTANVTVKDGYELVSVEVKDADGNSVSGATLTGNSCTFTMPADDVTVTAITKPIEYTVTAVTPTNVQKVEVSTEKATVGQTITVKVTVGDGYKLTEVKVTGENTNSIVPVIFDNNGGYTFDMPAEDVKVTPTVEKEPPVKHKITVTPDPNAQVSTVMTEAAAGDTVEVYVKAHEGYEVTSVMAGGVAATKDVDGIYTFTMPDSDVTVTATIEAINYTVNAAVNDHAVVNLSNNTATIGQTITATVTVKDGYELKGVEVKEKDSGKTVPVTENSGIYSFDMPAANVIVTATTEASEYTVTAAPAEHAAVILSQTAATIGQTITANVVVDDGYKLKGVEVKETVSGKVVDGTLTGNDYSFNMPAANVTVTATTEAINYTVNAAVNEHATVNPYQGTATVGEKVGFKVTVDSGYKLTGVVVQDADNNPVHVDVDLNGKTGTFTMPADDVTVTVTTKAIGYKVTAAPAEHAAVTLSQTAATIGQTITATVKVDPGYELVSVEVKDASGNPVANGTTNSCNFAMPASDVTVIVTTKPTEYTVTPVTPEHVSEVKLSHEKAYVGNEITVKVTVDGGYVLTGLTVSGNGGPVKVISNGDGKYTFDMPASDVVVTPSVEVEPTKQYNITVEGPENGEASATVGKAAAGQQVTVHVKADEGYEVASVMAGNTAAQGSNGIYTFEMPESDVKVTVTTKAIEYKVSAAVNEYADVTLSTRETTIGQPVKATVTMKPGYKLVRVEVKDADGKVVDGTLTGNDYSFNMPAANVTVTAITEPIEYNVVSVSNENAAVSSDYSIRTIGEPVIVTVNVDPGYRLVRVVVEKLSDQSTRSTRSNEVVDVNQTATGCTFNMPAFHVKVTAITEAIEYNVVAAANEHAGVNLSRNKATIGTEVTATVTVNPGYKLTDVVVTDAYGKLVPSNLNGKDCTFNMPASDVTITVFTEAIKYKVDAPYDPHATVMVVPGEATIGTQVTANVTVKDGYELVSVEVKDASGNPVANGTTNSCRFAMPASDVTVTAITKPIEYTVTPVTPEHVSEVKLSHEKAYVGNEITVKVTVDDGYVLTGVKVTGENTNSIVPVIFDNNGGYTFDMPAEDVKVTPTVEKKPPVTHEIKVTQVPHAQVSTVMTEAAAGDTVEVYVKANEGYKVTSVMANGTAVDGSNGIYTFTMPDSDVTVTASTEAINYTVTAAHNDHAVVNLTDSKATIGTEVTATVTVDPGYQLVNVEAKEYSGKTVPVTENSGGYSFKMPAADVIVTATTEAIKYTVTAAHNDHAVVTLSKNKAEFDEMITATVSVAPGYKLTGVEVKEKDSGKTVPVTENSGVYSFNMPASDVKVTVTTEAIQNKIHLNSAGGTKVTADHEKAGYLDKVTVTVTVDPGYKLESVEIRGASSGQPVPYTPNDGKYTFNMPAEAVTVTVTASEIWYKIDVRDLDDHSITTSNVPKATVGNTITLTARFDSGYKKDTLTIMDASGHPVEYTDNGNNTYTFTMPAGDVTATMKAKEQGSTPPGPGGDTPGGNTPGGNTPGGGNSGGGAPDSTTYAITVSGAANATVNLSATQAAAGDKITVTVVTESGYELTSFRVKGASDADVTVIDNGNGVYTFTMPAEAVTVTLTTQKKVHVCPTERFDDVNHDEWYHDALDFALDNGLMAGYDENTFGPNESLSRAMVAQIFYNLEGQPVGDYVNPFPDVAEGKWYRNAISWAYANKVVAGYGDGLYRPEKDVTREELVQIFFNYAKAKGWYNGAQADLTTFVDHANVAPWHKEAVAWGVAAKLISGKGGNKIDPQEDSLRCEAAQMLMNLCTNIRK